MGLDDREVRARVASAESLLERLESLADPDARETATDAVQAIVQLYGEALARMIARVPEMALALAEDELVSHLLLVHGLHPVDTETRVARALEEVRPYLRSHGGNVELLEVRDNVLRVRLAGSCNGCPSSSATVRLAIEDAIRRVAPELERIEAEGATSAVPTPRPTGPAWTTVGALPELTAPLVRRVSGEAVLFLRVNGSAYAYRPGCPGCGASLADGALDGPELRCSGCGRRYDVRQAGKCVDAPAVHLEPIPLLVGDAGLVKVAVAA